VTGLRVGRTRIPSLNGDRDRELGTPLIWGAVWAAVSLAVIAGVYTRLRPSPIPVDIHATSCRR
jgi:hypothetical protein